MAEPLDAVTAIHNAFRRDMHAIDSARGKPGLAPTVERFRFFMLMPPPAFARAKQLIQKAIGNDWAELTRRIPTLA